MIVREYYQTREDGVDLFKTYSDSGYFILQNETGHKYVEAIDVEFKNYTYSEIDELIEKAQEETINNE